MGQVTKKSCGSWRLMGLKWPIGRGEGVGAGESQREWKGWVPCPTGSLPFAHPMGCPLGHPNFTPWRHPTYRCYLRWPHRNFPRKPPMGKMLLEGGGGLSLSGFGVVPHLFTLASWTGQWGRGKWRRGCPQLPKLPSALPLPPCNLPSASHLPPQLHNLQTGPGHKQLKFN